MRILQRVGSDPRFWAYGVGPLVSGYVLLLAGSGKLRTEHVVLLGAMLVMNYTPRLRPLLEGILPFFLFGIVYDALRFITPVMHSLVPPRVEQPYRIEQWLFGIDGRVPSEVLGDYLSPPLLLAAGFAYFFFIYEVFFFGFYLVAADRDLLRRFGWGFFVLCLMGMVTYYIYPAAPPWYVSKYGFGPPYLSAPGDAARLVLVDRMVGVTFFEGFYARNSNIFGAVPSLHAAYPLLVWLYVRLSPLRRWHLLALAFWGLMCFSAVYLEHHYVIDVLLGVAYALVVYVLAEWLLYRRWPTRVAVMAPSAAPSES